MESTQSYGKNLPDQVERIASLYDAHLMLIRDMRELYRDRAALEREYAGKLQLLAKKSADKKAKMMQLFVVGGEPTKAWDENVLRQSTVDTAYTAVIDSVANSAQDHVNLADALNTQVVDILKAVERKNEDTKKKQVQFFQRLLSDRDKLYAERAKNKQKYDDECTEVEAYRQKQGRAQDDRHADRAAKQQDQQRVDMLNAKNTYLISMLVANKAKAKFYADDLPALEDQFQELQTRLVQRFSKVLAQAQALQITHQDVLKGRLALAEKALEDINPRKDQDLFVDYNVRPFSAPADWTFEPCAGHYDTDEMSVEEEPKIVLQNKLNKCMQKLQELRPLLDSKKQEVEQLSKLVTAYINDHSLGNSDEVIDNYLDARQQVTLYTSSEAILNAEIETILAALGDDVGGNRPHLFKNTSFSIPTTCGYCKSSIWGLSKQGKTCKQCNLSVHAKCEMKVPADCPGSRGGLTSRTSTISRTSSRKAPQAATPSSFVRPEVISESQEPRSTASVLFDFIATSPFELSITEKSLVYILEEDDGSGWVKVSDGRGGKGLVPASYIEVSPAAAPAETAVAGNPNEQGSGVFVRGIYDYVAQGADELEITAGEIIELSAGSSGGQNYADGWWEGINRGGRKGIFPSNYVEMV